MYFIIIRSELFRKYERVRNDIKKTPYVEYTIPTSE